MRFASPILAVLLVVPGWSGDERLALPAPGHRLEVLRVALDPERLALRRVGGLRYLGGVALASEDPAFGGFSALDVQGDRFALLSDGGNLLTFRMGRDWRPRGARHRPLPAGPGTGWRKADRDAEALAVDPATGDAWVAFENHNEVWRFSRELRRAVRGRAPPRMRGWPDGGGAEAMARLSDGRFVLLAERERAGPGARAALLFAGDPTDPRRDGARFAYLPAPGYSPVDAAELPDGRLLVVERRFRLPYRWSTRLALVGRGAVRAGARVRGRTLAVLAAPLAHDNFEGVAVVREGGATVLWLLSDDNQSALQRTLLLKFRVEG